MFPVVDLVEEDERRSPVIALQRLSPTSLVQQAPTPSASALHFSEESEAEEEEDVVEIPAPPRKSVEVAASRKPAMAVAPVQSREWRSVGFRDMWPVLEALIESLLNSWPLKGATRLRCGLKDPSVCGWTNAAKGRSRLKCVYRHFTQGGRKHHGLETALVRCLSCKISIGLGGVVEHQNRHIAAKQNSPPLFRVQEPQRVRRELALVIQKALLPCSATT